MSKENKKLSERIVDGIGQYEVLELQPTDMDTGEELDKEIRHKIVVDLGSIYSAVEDSKKAARTVLVDQIASDIDGGVLALSDTWAEDNLDV